uniref:Uncharacterized protein n=1 Tax=Anguilla anguilla TaxID=7936 RepID=A0A0E9TQ01_ANGAN
MYYVSRLRQQISGVSLQMITFPC